MEEEQRRVPYEGEAPLQRTGAQGRWRDSGPASLFPRPPRLRFPPQPARGGAGTGRAGHRARRAQGGWGQGGACGARTALLCAAGRREDPGAMAAPGALLVMGVSGSGK